MINFENSILKEENKQKKLNSQEAYENRFTLTSHQRIVN